MSIFSRKSDAEGRTLDIQTLNRAYAIGERLKALREAEQWLEQMQGDAKLLVDHVVPKDKSMTANEAMERAWTRAMFGENYLRDAKPVKSVSLAKPIALYAIQQQITVLEAELRSLGIAV